MPIKKNGPGCCSCGPTPCSKPFAITITAKRCFAPAEGGGPPPPPDQATILIAGPGGFSASGPMTFSGGQYSATVTAQTLGTYSYRITSASTFDHTGTVTVSNCSGANASAALIANVAQFWLAGCYYTPLPRIVGGSISIAYSGGASGSGTTGDDGYASIKLSGPEPQAGETISVGASAPFYKSAQVAYDFGQFGICFGFIQMQPIDCYQCYLGNDAGYEVAGYFPIGLGYQNDWGCANPQPNSGTLMSPYGSVCLGGTNATGDGTKPVFLGSFPASGFRYKVDDNGNDITCTTPVVGIQVPVYAALDECHSAINGGNEDYYFGCVRLYFPAYQRCDPNNANDKCYYPATSNGQLGPNGPGGYTSIALPFRHDGDACNPATMTGIPNFGQPLDTCGPDPSGNYPPNVKIGSAFGFIDVDYTYSLDNCGCDGGGPYASNTDQSPQAQPAMARYRGEALAPSSRLRVGLVCPWLLQGGAEAWQLGLADGLTGLLGPLISWEGAACVNTPADPAMVSALSGRMPVAFGWEAARELAARCDVIVTWHVADYAALFAGIPNPPKVVFACHLPTRWGTGTEALLSTVDRLVAVSPSAQAPIPPSLLPRSVVIPNAVDGSLMATPRTRAEVRASWGVPADAKAVGFLGRLSPEKDPDAAVRLAEEWPEGHVVVIGDGPLRSALSLGAPPNLHLVGADNDKSVLLAMDALMVPSLYESFGLSPAEAMTMGVPVLATETGIVGERPALARTVPIGAGGGEWADAVRADFDDAAGTARRVADARSFVREHYATQRFSRAYASVLADLAPAAVGDRIRSLVLPTPAKLATNFARAAFNQMVAGNPEASAEVQERRDAACRACPMLDPVADRCRECGCTAMKLKRRWATSRCPLGKWDAESVSVAA